MGRSANLQTVNGDNGGTRATRKAYANLQKVVRQALFSPVCDSSEECPTGLQKMTLLKQYVAKRLTIGRGPLVKSSFLFIYVVSGLAGSITWKSPS